MNILALDFGTKRIGMAWIDTSIGAVLPFGVIDIKGKKSEVQQQIIELLTREHVQKVVIGLPLGLDGKENENTFRIRSFVSELQSQATVPFELFDERFSSQAADKFEGEASRDEKAAMVILEGYLERQKSA